MFLRQIRTILMVFTLISVTGPLATAHAENGVSEEEILFGQTAALGGPAEALGTGMRNGIEAAFKEVNDQGGIKGRKLILKTRDDGYEPEGAMANASHLIEQEEVFALIGAVGTPTSKAIQPITSGHKVPLIGPFTGAEFLREPFKRYVVNVRSTYYQEAETWVQHLTQDLGAQRIAILYQEDSFGRAGLTGLKIALDKRDMDLAGEGTYKRNTTDVEAAVRSIAESNPDAIVTVGAYRPVAEFIRSIRETGIDVPILNISFVGSKALADDLGEDGAGIVITQVVPFPFDTSLPLVASYQKALQAANPDAEPDFVSLEGYMVGKLTAEVLKNVPGEITRESFLDTLYAGGTYDLGGVTLQYGEGDNQGMDEVFLTVIKPDGSFEAIEALD